MAFQGMYIIDLETLVFQDMYRIDLETLYRTVMVQDSTLLLYVWFLWAKSLFSFGCDEFLSSSIFSFLAHTYNDCHIQYSNVFFAALC